MLPQFRVDHHPDVFPGDYEFIIYMPPLPISALLPLQQAQIAAGGRLYSEGATLAECCSHCGSDVRVDVGIVFGLNGAEGLTYTLCLNCLYGEQLFFIRKPGRYVRRYVTETQG
jgi:hypothetical protein